MLKRTPKIRPPKNQSPETQSPENQGQPRLWLFYHYLYPDTVVSAIHMDQLSQGLQQRGWAVTGHPCNRPCREDDTTFPCHGEYRGVRLRRIWRPRFRQSSSLGRLLNAAWMIAAWSLLALEGQPPDAILIGTDPILSVLTAVFWRFAAPQTRILHWCFDLYPEAAYADGLLAPTGRVARLLQPLLRHAYRACNAIIDIGPCMRERLAVYGSPARVATVVPWALEEPERVLPTANEERQQIFERAALVMLYSGSFGRAHTFEDFLLLAQALRAESAALTFSIRGNREQAVRSAVASLAEGGACSIRFVPFAPADRLLDRLAAPDIHLLSLAPEWSGLVVPSKFFGALAVGRPVLFSGSADSSIAQWIVQYNLGWVLTPDTVDATAKDIMEYAGDSPRIAAMQQRCFDTYHAHFSRASGIEHVHALLTGLDGSQAL